MISNLYSASSDRNSGSKTTMAAPMSGPKTVPAPPTITTRRNKIDWKNENELGLTNAVIGANKPPASPAAAADSAKAMVRMVTVLRPIDCPAISESRTARMARPQGLSANRQ